MNPILKKISVVMIALSLCACASTTTQDNSFSTKENKKFTKYTNEILVETAESNYSYYHQFFENPENYGIDSSKVEVSLGTFYSEENENEKDELKELEEFNRSTLTKTQQVIYDELKYEFELSEDLSNKKYQYLTNCWSSINGLQSSLISYFSDPILRNEQDIQDVITLINDVPRYTNEVLKYTKKQAKKGTLSFDYDSVIETIQDTITNKESSSVTSALCEAVEELNLTPEKTTSYEDQIQSAMNDSFFTSYQSMLDTLTSLKDKVKSLNGLSHYKNGKKYYELLVKQASATDDSIEAIRTNVSNKIDSLINDFQNIYSENPDLLNEMDELKTDYTDVNQILVDLQNKYSNIFPEVETMEYNLEALPDDQCVSGVGAYFINPALDYTGKYQIRYNQRDYGQDPSDVSFYQTIAHEGIPGHMYAQQYYKEHFEYPIQYLLGYSGFTEGWANYVENLALNYLDADENVTEAYTINNELSNMYVLLMDISIHYDGYTLKEFKAEYQDVFSEESLISIYNQLADNPAVFMSYYYGSLKITELKEEAQEKLQDKYSDKDFHNAILQYGPMNFSIITNSVEEYITSIQ